MWLKPGGNLSKNGVSLDTLDCYTTLDYLPQITKITEFKENTYTSMVNDLIHDSILFQYPDYLPLDKITNTGPGPFSKEGSYHSNMAAFILVGKWLNFLQEKGVYDNMRIIIASDHGRNVGADYSGNTKLPSGQWLSNYHALLLYKDFDSRGNLVTDNTFMTQADVPYITLNNLIENPINPFTHIPITMNKENGVTTTSASAIQFKISNDQWFQVKDNIFIPENWKRAEP